LAEYAKRYSIKVIHISTDGVFKSRKTPYRENSACNNTDVYALSKRLGEVISPAVLNIRSSIIGPEFNKPAKSLLGWFLSRKDGSVVEGFINHIWNGVTTLQVSEFCYGLIFDKLFDSLVKETNVVHFAPNKPISKYGLLDVIKKTYQRNIRINKKKAKEEMIRILDSYYKDLYARYISNDMEYEVGRLRDYTYNFLKGERR
jgi:dTDP-4-dehydrorhamnose reductase